MEVILIQLSVSEQNKAYGKSFKIHASKALLLENGLTSGLTTENRPLSRP